MRRLILFFILTGSFSLYADAPRFLSGELAIRIVPGADYSHHLNFGPIAVDLTPQMAVWICTPDGKYVDTLYVTGKSAKGKWGAPGTRRPDALPVWSHARGIESAKGYFMPEGKTALPDAVSGATPKSETVRNCKLPQNLPAGKYLVRAEVNCSFDYNARYAKNLQKTNSNYNGVNGQPSLVYEAVIELPSATNATILRLAGAGSPTGADGSVSTNLAGIDTATNILKTLEVRFIPGKK
jgi:hypothetical protein